MARLQGIWRLLHPCPISHDTCTRQSSSQSPLAEPHLGSVPLLCRRRCALRRLQAPPRASVGAAGRPEASPGTPESEVERDSAAAAVYAANSRRPPLAPLAAAMPPVLVYVEFPFKGPWGEEMAAGMKDLAESIAAEPGFVWKVRPDAALHESSSAAVC